MGPTHRRDRGIALILSFLVLTLLTVVVMELVFTARVEMSLAQNFRDGLENTWAARSGVEIARGMIAGSWSSFDSPQDEWIEGRTSIEMGETEVSLRIRDEESKFNLRLLVDEKEENRDWAKDVLLRLVTIARENTENKDEPSPQKLVEGLVRWAQKGETGGPFKPGGGGRSEEDMDRRFLTLEEILFIDGFTPEILYGDKVSAKAEMEKMNLEAEEAGLAGETDGFGSFFDDEADETVQEEGPIPLARLLTVFGDGRINLNTAPVALIRALHPDMTAELAAEIDKKRNESPLLEETEGADGETAPPPPPPPPPDPNAPPPTPSRRDSMSGFRSTAEIREIEGVVDAGKAPPLDMHAELAGRLKVKSRFFKVRVLVKNERLSQRWEALIQAGDEEAPAEAAVTETGGSTETTEGETKEEPPPEESETDATADEPAVSSEPPKLSKVRILRMKAID